MPKFEIKQLENGSVVLYDEKPLALRKGLFCKSAKDSVKLEGLSNSAFREFVRICLITVNNDPDSREFVTLIERLGHNEPFRIHHNGLITESVQMFENEMSKMK